MLIPVPSHPDGIKVVYELEQKVCLPSGGGDTASGAEVCGVWQLSGRKLEDASRGEWAGKPARVGGLPSAPEETGVTSMSDLAAGALPEAHKKKDPFDFALWKAAKPGNHWNRVGVWASGLAY